MHRTRTATTTDARGRRPRPYGPLSTPLPGRTGVAALLAGVLLLAGLLGSPPAGATVRTAPVKAHLEGPERFAVAGEVFSGTLRISAARDVEVGALTLAGQGWGLQSSDLPAELRLGAGESADFAFAALPAQGFGPLELSGRIDGRAWRTSIDLSREAYGGLMPTDSDQLPPQRVLPAGGDRFTDAPALPLAALSADPTPPDPEVVSAVLGDPGDRNLVFVTGYVRYWHEEDHLWVPAPRVQVQSYIDTGGFLGWMPGASTETDDWGGFQFFCDGDRDTFFKIWAFNSAVVVETKQENTYQWATGVVHLPASGHYDLGVIHPTNSYGAALHILGDITIAHDYTGSIGYDVNQVDVIWPDNDESTSYYASYWEEIHLRSNRSWNDGTICHEWGHHWHYKRAHAVEMDYCNGICDPDPPDDCGHCGWCPERDEVTWMEGIAQFFSRFCTDRIETLRAFTPQHKDIDALYDDPSCNWDPWYIENVFAGVLWDMVDDDRGTETDEFNVDALGNWVYDQLDLEVVDVLNILTQHCDYAGHEPYRMPACLRCAAEYLTEMASPDATLEMLWETAWNFDLDLDLDPPSAVSNLATSFPINVSTHINNGTFLWDHASDDMSGVAGYSVLMHEGAPALPDETIDLTGRQHHVSGLTPGRWYFTVRPIDRAGRWGLSTSIGPILITEPGMADLAVETPAGWPAPLVVRSTPAPEIPDPVTQPSYVQGHTVYFNYAGRNIGQGPSGLFRDLLTIDGDAVFTSGLHSVSNGVGFDMRSQGPISTDLIGRHTVWVTLDGESAVPEWDESNNTYARQFVFMPMDLSPDEIVQRLTPTADPQAGESLLPSGTQFYPNCDGYDVEMAVVPELVWAAPFRSSDRYVLRLHTRNVGQNGFAAPLLEATTAVDLPAAVIQVPHETGLFAYTAGLSATAADQQGYRLCREQAQYFAFPDTIAGELADFDCLDFLVAHNQLGQDGWFTLKLVHTSTTGNAPIQMRFYEPGFEMGTLADADALLSAAPGDTATYHFFLPNNALALAVVSRDPRMIATGTYTLGIYHAKPDLEAFCPEDWYANVVPHVGRPYTPSQAVPAPERLAGSVDSTGIYYALRNASPAAPVPVGLGYQVALDGTQLFGSVFIEPLPPGHELQLVHNSLHTVRGGRHTLTHRINGSQSIDEDDYTNNHHGRQWVWSPRYLARGQIHALPAPPNAFGGLTHVTEGPVGLNCDGYTSAVSVTPPGTRVFVAYVVDDAIDVNIGLYASDDVSEGFLESHALSQWSGAGCDFVLCRVPIHTPLEYPLGVTLGTGPGLGDYQLITGDSRSTWSYPAVTEMSGVVEAQTCFDVVRLTMPAGSYRFTLESPDVDLGLSLHDLTSGFGSKTDAWPDGIVWQAPPASGEDATFVVTIPEDPLPTSFAVVIWRPVASSIGTAGVWTVRIDEEQQGVDPGLPALSEMRLVGAAPNPFATETGIHLELTKAHAVALRVLDPAGRLVHTLHTGVLPAGRHRFVWDGTGPAGYLVPAGCYLVQMRAGESVTHQRVVRLR